MTGLGPKMREKGMNLLIQKTDKLG